MAISRFDQPTPFQYRPLDIQPMFAAKAMEAKAKATPLQQLDMGIDYMKWDQAGASDYYNEYKNKMNEIALQGASGDTQSAIKGLATLKQDLDSPFNKKNMYSIRKKEYDTNMIDIATQYEDNPVIGGYVQAKQDLVAATTPENYDPATGGFSHIPKVNAPIYISDKDQASIMTTLSDDVKNTLLDTYKGTEQLDQITKLYERGEIKGRYYNDVVNIFANQIMGMPGLLESAKLEVSASIYNKAKNNGYSEKEAIALAEQYGENELNIFKTDENGIPLTQPKTIKNAEGKEIKNPHAGEYILNDNKWGRIIAGKARGRATTDLERQFIKDNDEIALENYKKALELGTQVEFGFKTPVVGLDNTKDDLIEKLELKDRGKLVNVSKAEYQPGEALYGSGKFGDMKVKRPDIRRGNLDKDEKTIINNIGKSLGYKEKDGKYTDEEYDNIREFISTNFNEEIISTYAESINPENLYPSGKKGTETLGAKGMTNWIFGGDKIKDAKVTGEYYNLKFYDPETNEYLTGKQFHKKVISKMNEDEPVSILNSFSADNVFTTLTDDYSFSKPYQVIVGNKQYIMSSPEKEIYKTIDPITGQEKSYNILNTYKNINKISQTKYSPNTLKKHIYTLGEDKYGRKQEIEVNSVYSPDKGYGISYEAEDGDITVIGAKTAEEANDKFIQMLYEAIQNK